VGFALWITISKTAIGYYCEWSTTVGTPLSQKLSPSRSLPLALAKAHFTGCTPQVFLASAKQLFFGLRSQAPAPGPPLPQVGTRALGKSNHGLFFGLLLLCCARLCAGAGGCSSSSPSSSSSSSIGPPARATQGAGARSRSRSRSRNREPEPELEAAEPQDAEPAEAPGALLEAVEPQAGAAPAEEGEEEEVAAGYCRVLRSSVLSSSRCMTAPRGRTPEPEPEPPLRGEVARLRRRIDLFLLRLRLLEDELAQRDPFWEDANEKLERRIADTAVLITRLRFRVLRLEREASVG